MSDEMKKRPFPNAELLKFAAETRGDFYRERFKEIEKRELPSRHEKPPLLTGQLVRPKRPVYGGEFGDEFKKRIFKESQ